MNQYCMLCKDGMVSVCNSVCACNHLSFCFIHFILFTGQNKKQNNKRVVGTTGPAQNTRERGGGRSLHDCVGTRGRKRVVFHAASKRSDQGKENWWRIMSNCAIDESCSRQVNNLPALSIPPPCEPRHETAMLHRSGSPSAAAVCTDDEGGEDLYLSCGGTTLEELYELTEASTDDMHASRDPRSRALSAMEESGERHVRADNEEGDREVAEPVVDDSHSAADASTLSMTQRSTTVTKLVEDIVRESGLLLSQTSEEEKMRIFTSVRVFSTARAEEEEEEEEAVHSRSMFFASARGQRVLLEALGLTDKDLHQTLQDDDGGIPGNDCIVRKKSSSFDVEASASYGTRTHAAESISTACHQKLSPLSKAPSSASVVSHATTKSRRLRPVKWIKRILRGERASHLRRGQGETSMSPKRTHLHAHASPRMRSPSLNCDTNEHGGLCISDGDTSDVLHLLSAAAIAAFMQGAGSNDSSSSRRGCCYEETNCREWLSLLHCIRAKSHGSMHEPRTDNEMRFLLVLLVYSEKVDSCWLTTAVLDYLSPSRVRPSTFHRDNDDSSEEWSSLFRTLRLEAMRTATCGIQSYKSSTSGFPDAVEPPRELAAWVQLVHTLSSPPCLSSTSSSDGMTAIATLVRSAVKEKYADKCSTGVLAHLQAIPRGAQHNLAAVSLSDTRPLASHARLAISQLVEMLVFACDDIARDAAVFAAAFLVPGFKLAEVTARQYHELFAAELRGHAIRQTLRDASRDIVRGEEEETMRPTANSDGGLTNFVQLCLAARRFDTSVQQQCSSRRSSSYRAAGADVTIESFLEPHIMRATDDVVSHWADDMKTCTPTSVQGGLQSNADMVKGSTGASRTQADDACCSPFFTRLKTEISTFLRRSRGLFVVGDEVSANAKYALHLEKRICALLLNYTGRLLACTTRRMPESMNALKMFESGQHISGVSPASIIATGTDSPRTRLDWSQLRVACIALNDIRACRQLCNALAKTMQRRVARNGRRGGRGRGRDEHTVGDRFRLCCAQMETTFVKIVSSCVCEIMRLAEPTLSSLASPGTSSSGNTTHLTSNMSADFAGSVTFRLQPLISLLESCMTTVSAQLSEAAYRKFTLALWDSMCDRLCSLLLFPCPSGGMCETGTDTNNDSVHDYIDGDEENLHPAAMSVAMKSLDGVSPIIAAVEEATEIFHNLFSDTTHTHFRPRRNTTNARERAGKRGAGLQTSAVASNDAAPNHIRLNKLLRLYTASHISSLSLTDSL